MAAGHQDLGFYLTKCEGIEGEYNDDTSTRSLKQILKEDVGETLESAVHFSFLYDFKWLLEQYPEKYRKLSMRLVVQQGDIFDELQNEMNLNQNASLLPIETPKYGTHHSKMILLEYEKSLRILVSTANLCEPDWSKKSQMVWVSPLLKKVEPKEGEGGEGDSSTGFRSSLCDYLRSYDNEELSDVADKVEDYDFSQIQSYFIFSTPKLRSGLDKLSSILESKLPPISNDCPVTFCFSSFGNLGGNADEWFRPAFGTRLLSSGGQRPLAKDVTEDNIKPIFPTAEEARLGGYTLTYRKETHEEQEWISDWLHKWKADRRGRSGTAPHVKFYIRTSTDYEDTYWFLMSSANLSKAAWGSPWENNGEWREPLSYECGVLHIPKEPLDTNDLVVPFDLPPERYGATDRVCVTT